MEKTMNRGNPVLKWPFNQNYSWQLIQEVTTKPRTTFKALQDNQCSWVNNRKLREQKLLQGSNAKMLDKKGKILGNIFCALPFGPEPSHHFTSLTSYNQTWWWWCDGLGLVCCFRTWPVCHNWWNHESWFHYHILKENVWHKYPDSFPNAARKSITHWLKKKKENRCLEVVLVQIHLRGCGKTQTVCWWAVTLKL